nr:uncharacterized protein LOC105850749 isoform X3 [Hydra vulgaris]
MILNQFVVCALHTGHIAIIPRPWLYKVCGIWKCRWTSSLEKTKNYSIFNPNWREYEITKIYAKTDTFNKAENIQADQSGKSDGSAVTLTDVENSITSATIPLGATPYKKRLRTPPNIDNSSEEFGKKIMKIRTRNSSPVYKDYSESDDTRSLELTNFELSDISEQDDLNLKDSSVNDDDSLQSLLKKLHVITLKSYQSIKELTLRVCRIEDDLCKIKLSLVGNIAEDNQDQMFVMEQYKTSDTFHNFCKMLEEDSVFRKLVIKFMNINYGQKSIGPCVRSILRASLSDNLMTLFNRTGSRGQEKLPLVFERCIYSTIKSFYEKEKITVMRGKEELETTIKKETEKQIELYFSNAKCRIKAKLKDKPVFDKSDSDDHILYHIDLNKNEFQKQKESTIDSAVCS